MPRSKMIDAGLDAVVIVSCLFEWQATLALFPGLDLQSSPFGDWFTAGGVVFFQGGWGKISAAASAQYVIDR